MESSANVRLLVREACIRVNEFDNEVPISLYIRDRLWQATRHISSWCMRPAPPHQRSCDGNRWWRKTSVAGRQSRVQHPRTLPCGNRRHRKATQARFLRLTCVRGHLFLSCPVQGQAYQHRRRSALRSAVESKRPTCNRLATFLLAAPTSEQRAWLQKRNRCWILYMTRRPTPCISMRVAWASCSASMRPPRCLPPQLSRSWTPDYPPSRPQLARQLPRVCAAQPLSLHGVMLD